MPDHVARIVDRALAFRKDDRFPDVAAMRAQLRALDGGQSTAPNISMGAAVQTGDSVLVSFDDEPLPEPTPASNEDLDDDLLVDLLTED